MAVDFLARQHLRRSLPRVVQQAETGRQEPEQDDVRAALVAQLDGGTQRRAHEDFVALVPKERGHVFGIRRRVRREPDRLDHAVVHHDQAAGPEIVGVAQRFELFPGVQRVGLAATDER
jgi:hypothetical protein